MACYLVFDVANLGMLLSVWSEEPIDVALAVIHPPGKMPKYKFTDRNGRSEIVRKIQDDHRKIFWGWCEFIKIGKEVKGEFELLDIADVTVAFNKFGSVETVEVGNRYNVYDFSGVAVTNINNKPFDKVQTMSNANFVDIGIKEGAALSLL